MLIEILKRTPPWVFVLFFVLLTFGYFQGRNRTVRRNKLVLLPAAMFLLSFYGVLSAFGTSIIGLAFWIAGIVIAVLAGVNLGAPRGVVFSADTQSFAVPGSWLPLALMMAIFFTKYGVGVVLARQLPFAHEPMFVGSISLCYGIFSGVFLARTIVIRRAAPLRA